MSYTRRAEIPRKQRSGFLRARIGWNRSEAGHDRKGIVSIRPLYGQLSIVQTVLDQSKAESPRWEEELSPPGAERSAGHSVNEY